MNNRLKVINLFGGPGAGKSTLAAEIFAGLKRKGICAELVTEYAKELVFEESWDVLADQAKVLDEQYKRIARLVGKVDIAITDGPILLSRVYDHDDDKNVWNDALDAHNEFNNWNIFVKRTKPYEQRGRYQKEEEAKRLDTAIEMVLKCSKVPYEVYYDSSSIKNPLVEMAAIWHRKGDFPKMHLYNADATICGKPLVQTNLEDMYEKKTN